MIDLPSHIMKPARYTGIEPLGVIKDPGRSDVRFALCFPDIYEVGMSYYGLFLLYELANSMDGVWCERCFAPWHDMDAHLRSTGTPLFTLESKTPLNRMDLVGFSLSYELNVTNVLNMLDLASIPLKAEDRTKGPIVIGGGPLTLNAAPFERFFDLIVTGEGDEVLPALLSRFRELKGERRESTIEELSKLDGVYAPLLGRKPVKRLIVKNLDASCHAVSPPIPVAGSIHNRLNVEISRGCGNGCRFCLAGFGYRPYRERSPERVKAIIDEGLRNTGYEEVSLLSLSSGDYSGLLDVISHVKSRHKGVSVSLPSLKIGSIRDEEISTIAAIARTGLTFALEAASAGLRCRLNKDIDVDMLHGQIPLLKRHGWRKLKLYFMIGFPWETDEDLWAVRDIIWPFEQAGIEINLSISPFIPKPHTPFQWLAMEKEETLMEKTSTLQRAMKKKRARVKYRDARTSLIEGIVARGDGRLTDLFLYLAGKGVKLEAWRECFRPEIYFEWFDKAGIDPGEFLGARAVNEALPWDFVDMGFDRTFLLSEFRKAESGEMSVDCLNGCADCGLGCETKRSEVRGQRLEGRTEDNSEFGRGDSSKSRGEEKMVTDAAETAVSVAGADPRPPTSDLRPPVFRYTFRYGKYGDSRYIGHLDTMNILLRAFRSSGLSIKTHGKYRPMPNISLTDALPVGVESTCEFIEIETAGEIGAVYPEIIETVNRVLPRGMRVYEFIEGRLKDMVKESSYVLISPEERETEGLVLHKAGRRFFYRWKGKSVKSLWQQGLFVRAIRVEDRRLDGSGTDR